MRLLLYSRDCVRLGHRNGCECALEFIVFADEEALPPHAVAGHDIELHDMTVSIVLRVADAPWLLPSSDLLSLPPGVNRCGFCQVRPRTAYLRVRVEGKTYMSVRRVQFPVWPVDTRVVFEAQGETFDAVVADMKRPPRIDSATPWFACYVMLSRAKRLEGFLVLRQATFDELSSRPPSYLLDEFDRLLELAGARRQRYGSTCRLCSARCRMSSVGSLRVTQPD